MTLDRDIFFPAVRHTLLGGVMTTQQFNGLNTLLAAAPAAWTDLRWLAAALGEAYHETNHTLQPVREAYWESEDWRKANLRYWPFYGRGYVQLTWEANYKAMSQVVGKDLVADPDLAMEPATSATILYYGLEHGSFTGRKLADYFNGTTSDFFNSRRMVNGLDRAEIVASYCQTIYAALVAASRAA